MRAVERTPWAERRNATHDAMCLVVAQHPERVFIRYSGAAQAKIEAPIGRGFVDVLAWTDAPEDEREYAIVEVKTNSERGSGGDIIRQLRWYREQLGRPARLVLVVPDYWLAPSAMQDLILTAGIEILPAKYFTEEA